jgi:hypothetical protein
LGGGVRGMDSPGSGKGSVAGCCECGDEPSGSGARELVILWRSKVTFTHSTDIKHIHWPKS